MAFYAYKRVRDRLPEFITEDIEEYEGGCDYDGDQWVAASDYIDLLENTVKSLLAGCPGIPDQRLAEHFNAKYYGGTK